MVLFIVCILALRYNDKSVEIKRERDRGREKKELTSQVLLHTLKLRCQASASDGSNSIGEDTLA